MSSDKVCENIMTEETSIREAIVSLLEKREPGKTICPSGASRAVFGSSRGNEKECMERMRAVVEELVEEGVLKVSQKRHVVYMESSKGPIRLRKKMEEQG
jgi:hypothetical protein